MSTQGSIRPMKPWQTILFSGVPAVLVYCVHWYLAPAITSGLNQPYLVAYLICWGGTELLFFAAPLVAYRLEGNQLQRAAFTRRFRLLRPGKGDLVWAFFTLIGMVTTYLSLSFTARWLAAIPAFSPHPVFPPELSPNGTDSLVPGVFMGMPIEGLWWVLVVYLVGWIFNILGEEMWYRGFMLPRQQAEHGQMGWVVNGLSFLILHVVWKWNLIALLPGSLILSYIAARRKSTWIGIIAHGALNISPVILLTAGIMGWGSAG